MYHEQIGFAYSTIIPNSQPINAGDNYMLKRCGCQPAQTVWPHIHRCR